VLAVDGQSEAGNELQDPLRHKKRTGVVRLRTAVVRLASDRYDRHVHGDAPHHIEQTHQQEYSSNYNKSAKGTRNERIFYSRFTPYSVSYLRTYVYGK